MVSIKTDDRMKRGLEIQAKREFTSVAAIVKKAIDRYLKEKGLDWENIEADKSE